MIKNICIGKNTIGKGFKTYCIAELSANHNQSFADAVSLIKAAKDAGADAIKLQTYTPDTLTIDCDNEYFRIGKGSLWEGKNLYQLYSEAYTPWEWQPELKRIANNLGMDLFSTPFDPTAVDFLEKMGVPAYKIASFEIVDIPLIQRVAQTGKPIILSTGMASVTEIHTAVTAIRNEGNDNIALLKCTSAYPARPEDMNLKTISHMSDLFEVPVGISDHTLGITVPVVAVGLGACIIEKHFTLSRQSPGPDTSFSLEPHEFRTMVDSIRQAEVAVGKVNYGLTEGEHSSRVFRRSLFAVEDIPQGEPFTNRNVRSIRPGHGLKPQYLQNILGKKSKIPIKAGTPLTWDMIC